MIVYRKYEHMYIMYVKHHITLELVYIVNVCIRGNYIYSLFAVRAPLFAVACKIQMSPTSYLLLWKGGRFTLEKRGLVTVKGKGEVNTFWLQGEKPLNSGGDRGNLLLTKEDVDHYPILQTWLEEFGVQLDV